MASRYLPIGSVVQLKNSTASVMVAGYLAREAKDPDHVWDYSGFKFPIGFVKNDETYCFDNSQIETVLALGYQETEQFQFMTKLEAAAARLGAEAEERQNSQEE